MPRTRKQNDAIKDKRRQDIIDAGLDLFIEKGFGGTSIDDITKKLKISHGLFYHYYKDKEELLLDVRKYTRGVVFTLVDYDESDPLKYIKIITKRFLNMIKNPDSNRCLYFIVSVSLDRKIGEIYHKNIPEKTYLKKLFESFIELGKQKKLVLYDGHESFLEYMALINGLSAACMKTNDVKPIQISLNSLLITFVKEEFINA